jgi:hypothetical protein
LIALTPSSHGKDSAMQTRRRFKQTTSLQDRLSEFVNGERAESMPESADQYELRKKIRQAETAADIEKWANSPEQPPNQSASETDVMRQRWLTLFLAISHSHRHWSHTSTWPPVVSLILFHVKDAPASPILRQEEQSGCRLVL